MARQKFEKSFNTFVKGLMTEASELNFPEDFSLYEKNFLLHRDGGRDRRKGMELVYPLGVILTSRPYAIEAVDESKNSVTKIKQAPDLIFNDETIVSSFSIVGGEHRATLFEYKNWPQEATEQSFTVVGGVHNAVLVEYKEWPTEETTQAFSISGGRLHKVLIPYSNWPQEATEQSFTIVGGIHDN